MTGSVLCLENIACETLGNLEELLLSDGFEIEKLNPRTQQIPRDPSGYRAVIILGGPMSVYDNLGFINEEIDLVRKSGKRKTPLLGICLGSQIIAQAIGGNVFRGARKEIGWHQITIEKPTNNLLFSGYSNSQPTVFQWHGDTYSLPKDAVILASSELYPQAFASGSLIGIQFHLEVTAAMIESWLMNYKSEVISERIDSRKILKESAAYLTELQGYSNIFYRNFCNKFSL